MHNPPDLSLASSYIPACMCLLKSVLAFVLFVLSPVKGWIGLCCLVTVDRILWNRSACILDVNAVAGALVGGLMIVRARADGIHTALRFAIHGVWVALSACQITGLSRLSRAC